ncbi:hypothetical protein SDC9_211904 [bioreactor metagenome]|uniref:Uncharacterized protein n=1 Tax=bioreactor metagenome TaxID=1076179 RepID=A0A645JYF9_9ZZZZ
MVDQHRRVVHLVNVVACENQDVLRGWMVGLENVDILIHGIGRSAVPGLLVDTLLRWQEIDELVVLPSQEAPPALDMPQQAVRLVLGDDSDAPDARIDAVGHRKIDDPVLPAEINRRLGATIRQLIQPAPTPASQHQRHRSSGQLKSSSFYHVAAPFLP